MGVGVVDVVGMYVGRWCGVVLDGIVGGCLVVCVYVVVIEVVVVEFVIVMGWLGECEWY